MNIIIRTYTCPIRATIYRAHDTTTYRTGNDHSVGCSIISFIKSHGSGTTTNIVRSCFNVGIKIVGTLWSVHATFSTNRNAHRHFHFLHSDIGRNFTGGGIFQHVEFMLPALCDKKCTLLVGFFFPVLESFFQCVQHH